MREMYIIQPYLVGSKHGRSLAVIIPAQIAREYKINASTAFTFRVNRESKSITLQIVDVATEKTKKEMMRPADESFQAPNQQVSSSGDQ
jgi:antitoxin component of MazEF toxin-antitoxin module